MSPKYFDIHSHLYFPDYDSDRQDVIDRMNKSDIGTITIGTNIETSKKAIETTVNNQNIYATVGLHPADEHSDEYFDILDNLIINKKVVGIGECGLDYFRLKGDVLEIENKKRKQKEIFDKHIELAIKHNKPLMIHCRNAYEDMIDILSSKKREFGDRLKVHFHFFTEPIETARKIMDMNFTVSFTGVITFVDQYHELVSYVPFESMMSETDAPYVAPKLYRGQRNEPTYVLEVIKKIAEIKGVSFDDCAYKLRQNVTKVFGI
jgi:TatD DNase family protein